MVVSDVRRGPPGFPVRPISPPNDARMRMIDNSPKKALFIGRDLFSRIPPARIIPFCSKEGMHSGSSSLYTILDDFWFRRLKPKRPFGKWRPPGSFDLARGLC
jgi:hypothetical protein